MDRKPVKTDRDGKGHELIGLIALAAALVSALTLVSYSPLDRSLGSISTFATGRHNIIGPFGSYISDIVFQFVGGGGFLIPVYLTVFGINRLTAKERSNGFIKLLSAGMMLLSVSVLLRLITERLAFGGIRSGGLIGGSVAGSILGIFGIYGAYILTLTIMLGCITISTRYSLMSIFGGLRTLSIRAYREGSLIYIRYSERHRKDKIHEEHAKEPASALPEIVEPPAVPVRKAAPQAVQEALPFKGSEKDYQLPSMNMLADPPPGRRRVTKEALIASSAILEKKLANFGVEGKVVQVNPGPVVTMYEFEPADGIKVNKISGLQDDLALAMRAESVRIVAPIPGKAAVGIEIPNNVREEVYLKEIMASSEFGKAKSPLTLALGKDIYGMPSVSDLAKMPHLLIAGATGSGKSVAINTMVMSLLMNARPRDLRMVMVDPKRLELSVYDGIPHLLEAVITEPRRAASSLRRVVVVMEERYKLLAEKGVRNIEGFNAKVVEENMHPKFGIEASAVVARPEAVLNTDGTLPYVVVIIDELADLMMVASKEVEDSIARLAQMARASGIHLVLATQRPSVDVLTGVIKANFPARISFQVSSKTDSRTILDANGAEALLGKGDMLFLPPGSSKLKRVHGSYVSEDEIDAVVTHLKKQGAPKYDDFSLIIPPAFETKKSGGRSSEGEESSDSDADRYAQAVELVMQAGKASASLLQRRMRIGYPTASRIIEQMEEEGLIGPKREGGKEREVFKKF